MSSVHGASAPTATTTAQRSAGAGSGPASEVVDRARQSLISDELRAAAAERPVDAVLFLREPDAPGVQGALDALTAAEQLPLGRERKTQVFEALTTISRNSRAPLMPLAEQAMEQGRLQGVDSLWSFNAVRLRGADLRTLEDIVATGAVEAVTEDKVVARLDLPNNYLEPVVGKDGSPALVGGKNDAPVGDPNGPEHFVGWGVKQMDAVSAWKQGITGAGVVVGSLDSGVITDHPGLARNYRGTRPDGTQEHNYNWGNFVEGTVKDSYPIDDVGHGTHTIGNSVGYHPKHLIGVAPDAQFIAARGLGNGAGTIFQLMAAMDWMLAPTDLEGNNPRPDLAPDIVTNSWGAAGGANIPFLWHQMRNWRRAGIIPVFASGNTGRPGATVGSVASPGMYAETITVGATEKDESRAFFSNRGPSRYSNDVKPEVVAPGTNVYSAWTDGTFRDTFVIDGKPYPASGTSMATPHVAGAIALYLQAHPGATYDEVLSAVTGSATTPDQKDHDTGYGRVQVEKLVTDIDPKAELTPKARVAELLKQWQQAEVFNPEKDAPKTRAADQPKATATNESAA